MSESKTRIFVRDFSSATTKEDVTALISKVCPVKEVYIPGKTVTGWQRLFAIVVVDADSELQQKCIKAFNNSLWNGSRIHLEVSNKQYYVDRLRDEKKKEEEDAANEVVDDMMEMETTEEEEEEVAMEVVDMEATDKETAANGWSSNLPSRILYIKKSRDGPPLMVSTQAFTPKEEGKKSKKRVSKILSCGRRVVFEYDEMGQLVAMPQAWADLPMEPEPVIKESGLKDRGMAKEVKKSKDELKTDKTNKKTNDETITKTGGGARKGFGTLLAVPEAALPLPLTEAERNKSFLKPGTEDRDCCVEKTFGIDEEDMRNFRQSEYLDRLESDDEYDNVVVLRPCVKPLELTDEALDKERQRSLDVLAAVLGKSKAVPVVKTTVSKTSSAAADGGSSAVSTSVETGASSSSSSNSKTTKEQKEKEKLKEKSKEKAKEEEPFPVEEGPGKYTGTVASGFAQLGALKDIFHKEGGVWFGDDPDSLKESVSKGVVAEDALFREAEKLGFDIRVDRVPPGGSGIGGDTSSGSGSAAAGGMMFSFFPEVIDEVQPEVVEVPLLPAVSPADGENHHSVPSKLNTKKTAAVASGSERDAVSSEPMTTPVVFMSWLEIIENAKKFSRDRTEEVVVQTWREQRDKLVVDYKRKRKDTKKKNVQGAGTGGSSGGMRMNAGGGSSSSSGGGGESGGGSGGGGNSGGGMEKRKKAWQVAASRKRQKKTK